jgi:spoIIIJ-associated protein
MDSIEQTGRTVDDAVEAALNTLGVARDEVDVEVLAEERRGLLGILGSSSARVRVTVRQEPGEPETPPELRELEAEEPQPPDLRREVEAEEPQPPDVRREAEAEEPQPPDVRREAEAEEPQPAVVPTEAASELAQRAVETLTRIIELMGLEATVEVTGDDEESVSIDMRSEEDLGLLIGRRGQTLSALQLLVAMMANRNLPPDLRRRVILDAEGYRARRDRSLRAMARSAAQRAKRSGRPVTLSSLNPRERRVVHLALADDPSVTTRSEGDDPDRSIIVTARRRNR